MRDGKPVSPAFLFATLLWHEVLQTWNAAKGRGEKPLPALFDAMDHVLEQQAQRISIPRRFEATIKEIWSLQPRFEQRAGARPYRLLEHPRFRAAYDFLELRGISGEVPPALVDWWTKFQDADDAAREAMLKPDEAPKKSRRSRGRGRKHRDDAFAGGSRPTRDRPTANSAGAKRAMATVAFVGLGSNLAHPRRQIARAVAAIARLPRTRIVALSPNYATAPLGLRRRRNPTT